MKLVLIYDVLKIIITILRRDSKDSCDQKHCVHIVPRRAFRKMAMGASSRWIYSFVFWHNKRLTQLVRLSKKIGWSGLILYRQQTRVSQSWVWLRLTLPFTASNIIVNKSASRRIPWNPAVTMFFFFFWMNSWRACYFRLTILSKKYTGQWYSGEPFHAI